MTREHAPVSLSAGRDAKTPAEGAEALRRERDLLSAILDTAGALVAVLDRQGRIVRFNRACETTTGYSLEEAKGKALWDLFLVPEEIEPVRAVFEQLRAGQFPNEYENYWLTKDGSRRLIAWTNTALLGADGTVEYVVGTGIDITERRQAEAQRDATLQALRQAHDELELRVTERTAELQRANQILEEAIAERSRVEEALRESEGHMRSLMENARSYAVYRLAVDPTHPYLARPILASPSMADLLNIPDLHDFTAWFAHIHPDDIARVVEANHHSLHAGVPFDQQFRILKAERGEWDWVHVRSTPVFDSQGRLTYFDGLVVDITTQKHTEEEIRRQNEFLAALHETALGVVSRLDVADLLETAMERAVSLFDATYGFIWLVRPEDDELEIYIGTGPARAYVGQRVKRGEGLAGRVCDSGQPLAVNDYSAWSGRARQFEGRPFGPALEAPLMSGAEVVGVLGVAREPTAPPFGQHDIDLIRRFSHLASIALDNARMYASLQQGLALEELIGRISAHFVNLGPAEVDAGIQYALQAIGGFSGVDRSYVFQFSGDGTTLDNTHEWCAEGIASFVDSLKGMPRAAFPWFLEKLERFEAVSLPRVAEMPPEASVERSECEREGIQSIILVPLAYRGALAGFLGFDAVRAEVAWTEETTTLLTIVGDLIVNALEHKRAQAIQDGQRQFLELLATGGEFYDTLHTLARLIEDQWPGMLGLVLLLDEDGKHLHIGASVSLPQDYVQSIEGLEIGPMVGSCGTACFRRERVIVEDTATDPRWEGLRDLALQYNLRACWSEPVLSPDGQVVGTFAMYYHQPRAPSEAELRAIEMGAHLVGVAVEHKRAETALRESESKFRGIVEYANIGIAIVQNARFRFVNPHYAAMMGYTVEELLGQEFMGYCAPEERDRIVDFYTRRTRGEPVPPRYETAMLHKYGARVYAEVSVGIIPYGGQQATFVFLRDITEQKRAQQALQEAYGTLEQRVEERTRELATLNVISGVVSRSLDLNEIMGSALDKTMEAAQMEMGAIYRALLASNPEDRSLRVVGYKLVASRGISEALIQAIDRIPLRNSAMEQAAALGRPYVWRIADVPPQAGLAELLEKEGMHFAVSIPLMARGQVVGSMNVGTRRMHAMTPEVLSLLAAIGQQVGMAVENARLHEQAQEAAAMAERGRLARELHDSVTQSLYSVTMYAEAAARLMPAGHEAATAHLRDARDTAQEALREMRLMIYQLRPPALEKGGLAVALQVRLDAVERRGGIHAELTVEGEDRLPPAVQTELHQIAQEALNNALKHAHAERVQVSLRFGDTTTTLQVCDDGVGFELTAAQARGGLGLPNMRERAGKIGGRLSIESTPGRGTRVLVEVPSGGEA
jgi:PAS domain S-box-containing protein